MGRGMTKRILKWLGVILILLLAGLLLLAVVLQKLVTPGRVEAALESALGRRVSVVSVAADLFAPVSGVVLRGLRISDRAPGPGPRPAGAVPDRETCLAVPELIVKARLLPLLSGRLALRRFALHGPDLRLTLFADGTSNLGELLAAGGAGPLHAAELPLAISLRRVSIDDGRILILDMSRGQATRIDGLRLELPGLQVDPRRLGERNGGEMSAGFGLRSHGRFRSGGFAAFDLALQVAGRIRPFSPRSGELDPRVECRAASSAGSLRGVRLLVRLNELLERMGYGGARVPADISWDQAAVEVVYEGGRLELKNGSISGGDAEVSFSGTCATAAGGVELELGVRLAPAYTPAWRGRIRAGIAGLLPASLRRAVDPDVVAGVAMASLAGKDGRVFLKLAVSGTLGNPRLRLLEPHLPSLAELARTAAGAYLETHGQDMLRRGLELLLPH